MYPVVNVADGINKLNEKYLLLIIELYYQIITAHLVILPTYDLGIGLKILLIKFKTPIRVKADPTALDNIFKKPLMRLSNLQKVSVASTVIIPITLAIISILVIFRIQKVEFTNQSMASTQNVLLHSQKIMSKAVHFNIFLKNSLFSNASHTGEQYQQIRNELGNMLISLKRSNTREVIPQENINHIIYLISNNLDLSDKIIVHKLSGRISSVEQAAYLNESAVFIDKMRDISNSMDKYQVQLLESQKNGSEKQFFRLKIIFFIVFLAIIITLIFIITKTKSDLSLIKKTNKQIINLAKMVENTNDAIILAKKDLTILTWNKGAERIYGYSSDEAVGKKTTELFKNETQLIDVTHFDFNKDSFFKKEIPRTKKNGAPIIISASLNYTIDNSDADGSFLIIVSDITEKKKNEIRINQLATIVESTNDAIYTTDINDVITHWNRGAERLYGFPAEDALNKKSFEVLPAYTPILNREDAFKNKESTYFREEITHRKKDGKLIIVSISVTPLKDENNTISGYIFIAHDITELKQLGAELKNLNEHLGMQVEEKTSQIKEIFERLTDGFVALDKNWNFTYANKRAEEILKKQFGSLVGKNLRDEFPDPNQRFYKAYSKAFDTQQDVHFEDYYEPEDFWLENHIYPSPNGITIFLKDTTEQKRAQEELVKLNYRFRSLSSHLQNSREEERIHIAREIHDELGQLTTALKMDMSWLRKKVDSQNLEIRTKLDDTIILLDEMVKTIRRIAQELRPSILDNLGLSAAIEWYVKDFEKRTSIKCRFINKLGEEDNLSPSIKTSLFRICQESLTNVMRHSEATEVECSLKKTGNKIYLSIHDNGKGFDTNQKSKSFGLLGMQERAIMVNGQLKIESNPEIGSIINVEIEL